MLTLLLLVVCGTGCWANQPALPSTSKAQEAAACRQAVLAALETLEIKVSELQFRGNALHVAYEDAGTSHSSAYVLAAVARLVAPLASSADEIRIKVRSGSREVVAITFAPDDVATVAINELTQPELARLGVLTHGVQAQATVVEPAVDVVAAPDETDLTCTLLDRLQEARLENLSLSEDSAGGYRIGFENRTYRSDLEALAVCVRTAAEVLPPLPLMVEARRDKVPVCSIRLHLRDYAASQAALISPEELARRWQVLTPASSTPGVASGASSTGKVDISVRPAIRYEIGNEADAFEGDSFLTASVDSTIGRGWHAHVQSSTRMSSGLSAAVDRALVSRTQWLAPHLLATASAGKFGQRLYGWYGEVQWEKGPHRLGTAGSALRDSVGLGAGSGSQAITYYEYEAGDLGLAVRLGYGGFVDSRASAGFISLRRRFGESLVSADVLRDEHGEEALKFRLSLPFGPRVAAPPSALRVRTDRKLQVGYKSDFTLQGEYLQDGQDLSSFRGELSPPYVKHHLGRLLSPTPRPACTPGWLVSPSLEGTSGLIRIPTADVIPDGGIVIGASYIGEQHARIQTEQPTHLEPLYFGMGLLPNLEAVGRLTVLHDVKAYNWSHNLDRSLNLHYRLFKQAGLRPAVALGVQDVMLGTSISYTRSEAQYVVASWESGRHRAHLGMGRERLAGLFGGVDYSLTPDRRLRLLADYDTEFVNVGLRGFIGKTLSVDLCLLGAEELAGGISWRTVLR